VRIEGALEPAEQDELLGRIAAKPDREHALCDWPQLKAKALWQDRPTGMIAAVQKFDWIDNESRSIRAHIAHAA
jgi:hypothetical protein